MLRGAYGRFWIRTLLVLVNMEFISTNSSGMFCPPCGFCFSPEDARILPHDEQIASDIPIIRCYRDFNAILGAHERSVEVLLLFLDRLSCHAVEAAGEDALRLERMSRDIHAQNHFGSENFSVRNIIGTEGFEERLAEEAPPCFADEARLQRNYAGSSSNGRGSVIANSKFFHSLHEFSKTDFSALDGIIPKPATAMKTPFNRPPTSGRSTVVFNLDPPGALPMAFVFFFRLAGTLFIPMWWMR
ncbi:hypothetical protein FNV43_RR17083 [Rhamnella rubrinervis]|uniref:Uncharacterized protein n=1 Tax=Rhamnella rubrinervis TaxID=2594499 RepID=A0A8K0GZX6_9ROSA|nr:hypothetical protein FNV43_RR17083 [Rhamnella rubrinervis]